MSKIFSFFIIIVLFFRELILANTQNETYINTTNIIYDEKNNIVELSDNSKINIGNTNILVDRGIIDYNKDELEVFGNFYLYQELNILSGKDLKGSTKLNKFKANDVSYIYNNDLKIDAESAERNNNLVVFYNNFLTPCELDGFFNCPTWSLRIDKTEYDIEKDKFTHFDTFLQIADYKLFYLPYFSHYGYKAPRQKGFLTPTLEFTIGGNSGLKTPYYLPLNISTDVTFIPTFYFDQNFEFLENYALKTHLKQKTSGGYNDIAINTKKNKGNTNVNTSVSIKTKQVINKNMVMSANGVFTNSISTTRSLNEDPITFENIYLKLENYDFLLNNDYLKSEISTVESFDSTNINSIPISPSLKYHNIIRISEKYNLISNVDYRILNRDDSNSNNPSENYIFNVNNYLDHNLTTKNINIFNKVSSLNSIYDYNFEHNESLNRQENSSNFILSSDVYFNYLKNSKPRIKIIYPKSLVESDNIVNEDSEAISFNYINQYSDSRFFGNDLKDNTPRIVYGIENKFEVSNQPIQFNINQSFDFNENNNFYNKTSQSSRYSDYALEAKTSFELINFQTDLRLNEKTMSRKEMNYSLILNKPIQLSLVYNETDKSAYDNLSKDTQSMKLGISKEINDNLVLSYNTNLDLKNDYSPYSSSIRMSLFDECSNLDIKYTNIRFNDDYNTTPEEKISITFSMDYLGFFGYEQSTNLFFEETGTFNYGL
tara:strand:+ start:2666 stop:4810 length:2145 start_codon:yes stop_codon:yes gene_type:complete